MEITRLLSWSGGAFYYSYTSTWARMQHKIKQSSGKSDRTSHGCENVTQYLLSSSLHGLRYIGTASLSLFERLFFSLSFLMVVILAAYFISNVWQKWKETPVICVQFTLDPCNLQSCDSRLSSVSIPFQPTSKISPSQLLQSATWTKWRKTLRKVWKRKGIKSFWTAFVRKVTVWTMTMLT